MELRAFAVVLPLLAGCQVAATQATRTAELFYPTAAPLFARAECPGNTFQCPASLGQAFSDVCCENGQSCAFDEDSQPACCPSGVVCTGNAPSAQPTGKPKAPASYVSNQYFSFPYIGTDFDSQGECTSAVSACSANYDACITRLGGDSDSNGNGDFGVTIVVPGSGGTTIEGGEAGATSLGASSATQVCRSLSSEACSDVKETECSEFRSGDDDDDNAAASGKSGKWAGPVLAAMVSAATVVGLL